MRVLRVLPTLGAGGTERQCLEVLEHAAAHEPSAQLDLATLFRGPHALAPAVAGRWQWHALELDASALGLGRASAALTALARGYDLVHAMLRPAIWARGLAPSRQPWVASLHTTAWPTDRLKDALTRASAARARAIAFNAEAGRAALARRVGRAPEACWVIENGKPAPPALDPAAPRAGLVCVARRIASKRHDLLVQACARLPGLEVTLVGEGTDDPDWLRSELRAPPHVVGLGVVEDVASLLARAQIAALPTEHEGLPNAVLEAWAQGAALIASDAPGVRELVRDGVDGLLVPNEVNAWARALGRLVDDPGRRLALARAGHARLGERFSLDRCVARWFALYRWAAAS